MIDPIIEGLGSGNKFTFRIVLPGHCIGCVSGLTDGAATPDIRGDDRSATACWRTGDCRTAPKCVIGEYRSLAWLIGVGDLDQSIFRIPAIGSLAVRQKVAVSVPDQRLTRKTGELIEIVVGGDLCACRRVRGGYVTRFGYFGYEILRSGDVIVCRVLADRETDIADLRQPSIARVGQVIPTRCQCTACKPSRRDLGCLTQIAESKRTKVTSVRG